MTDITISLTVPSASGVDAPAVGSLDWQPTSRRVESPAVILPASFSVALAGTPVTVTVDPTGPTWCWRVLERVTGGAPTWRYLAVPDSLTAVAYSDLVEVDPKTLDPIGPAAAAAWAAALAGKIGAFRPEAYGAVGDGVTNDTAAVQAAFNAVPATGGHVYFGGRYYVPGGITCSKRVLISGAGGFDSALNYTSGLTIDSPTVTALTITAPGCTLTDFTVINTWTVTRPTAGAGILFAGVNGGDYAKVSRLSVVGFWNDIQFDNGYWYMIDTCHFIDPVHYGAYFRNTQAGGMDHGDQGVMNCVFSKLKDTSSLGTAIRWESGGGMRIVGNKINGLEQIGRPSAGGWEIGIDLDETAWNMTGVLVITGNSIEGAWSLFGVRVRAVTANFINVNISGNEFQSTTAGGIHVAVNGTGANLPIRDVIVANNIFSGGGNAVSLKSVSYATVQGNVHSSGSTSLSLQNVLYLRQSGNYWAGTLEDTDAFNDDLTTAGHARDVWEYRCELPAPGVTTAANYGYACPGSYAAGVMTVTIGGDVATLGGAFVRQSRAITKAGAGLMTVTAVGTDVAAGLGASDITLTWSIDYGLYAIRPRVASVHALRGFIRVEYDGALAQMSST